MKLNFEIRDGLQRCLTVQLSEQRFKRDIIDQLSSLGKNLEIKEISGSGDIIRALEQQFGVTAREKVLNGMIKTSFEAALQQSKLNIVGKPVIEVVKATSGSGFIYNAIFEVYPAVTLPNLKVFKFTQLAAEITDEDVDRTLLVMRRQQAKWCPVDRPAQTGDSVIINYFAQVAERVFEGKAMRIELNGDDVIMGFENGLIGVSVAKKLSLPLDFPEDHYQAEVAGKTVIFNVEVIQIEAMVLPELDTDFIISHGAESGRIEVLRSAIQHNMNAHLQKNIRVKNTLTIMADIVKQNPVDVPQCLLKEEVTRLTCDPCEEVEGVDSFAHEMDPAMFTELAYNRVARSLMVTELASANGIELDTEEVRVRLEDLVAEYSDKERIIDWFYEDKVRLAGIESDVLGEQVADWILENMQAEKVNTTYSEMMGLTDSV